VPHVGKSVHGALRVLRVPPDRTVGIDIGGLSHLMRRARRGPQRRARAHGIAGSPAPDRGAVSEWKRHYSVVRAGCSARSGGLLLYAGVFAGFSRGEEGRWRAEAQRWQSSGQYLDAARGRAVRDRARSRRRDHDGSLTAALWQCRSPARHRRPRQRAENGAVSPRRRAHTNRATRPIEVTAPTTKITVSQWNHVVTASHQKMPAATNRETMPLIHGVRPRASGIVRTVCATYRVSRCPQETVERVAAPVCVPPRALPQRNPSGGLVQLHSRGDASGLQGSSRKSRLRLSVQDGSRNKVVGGSFRVSEGAFGPPARPPCPSRLPTPVHASSLRQPSE
jgi:hypothetical protein